MSVWRAVRLGDFVRVQRGYDLPERERRAGEVPVMGSAGQSGTHDTALVSGPGIVIGRSGASYGVVSWCDRDFWPLNTALFVTDFLGNDRRFTYYFLRGLDLSGYNVGSAQPSLNRNHIYPIQILVPDIDEQRAIGALLGALDDKMALNRRMNRTLEATAAALFRSWFIDFDPVVAKVDGNRALGVPETAEAMMPSRFIETPAGAIPEGWRIGDFGEIARVSRNHVTPDAIAPGTPYIAMEHMPRRSIALDTWEKLTRVDSAKARYLSGDLLFGKLRPYFHKVGLAPNDGVCSTEILVLQPSSPEWRGPLVCTASSVDFVEYASAAAEGTRMPRVSWSYLSKYTVPIPPAALALEFTNLVNPLFEHIIANVHESRTLAAVRDALLPQLLSGEIRLGQAERAVAALA